MKILIINASPRPGGNSAYASTELYEKYKTDNAELINLAKLDIKSCNACRACKTNNSLCVIKDDMALIYPKLLSAEKIIFITPLHFGFLSSLAKIFTDRWYCLKTADKISKFQEGKKAFFLLIQGAPSRERGEMATAWAKHFFTAYGLKYFSFITPACSHDNLDGIKIKIDEIKMNVSIF